MLWSVYIDFSINGREDEEHCDSMTILWPLSSSTSIFKKMPSPKLKSTTTRKQKTLTTRKIKHWHKKSNKSKKPKKKKQYIAIIIKTQKQHKTRIKTQKYIIKEYIYYLPPSTPSPSLPAAMTAVANTLCDDDDDDDDDKQSLKTRQTNVKPNWEVDSPCILL